MLKLLRQYNQWILVVGGVLLMIAFLMPSTIESCARSSGASGSTWATYGGGSTVTGADYELAQQELRVIDTLKGQTSYQMLQRLGATENPAHWWLLVHEATNAGLVGGTGDGEAALSVLASGGTVSSNQVAFNIAKASGTNPDIVVGTLSKLQGVLRLVSLTRSVDRVSDRRLEQSVAKALLGVSGDVVVIDARKSDRIEAPAPSEDALKSLFDKFADKAAPAAPGMDNFGYRSPDRFKLEWLKISKAAVAASVAGSPELETLALKKRFAQDPAKYAGAAVSPAFADFEATVRQKTTDELVAARMKEISKFASDQLGLAQRTLKREGAYFDLPADWSAKMPSLLDLATAVGEEYKIEIPAYQPSGDAWMTAKELEAMPVLPFATTDRFGAPVRLQQLVVGAKELSSPDVNAPFQLNIASPAMTDSAGDAYFVRMIAAEKSAPAADLASVRGEVERDAKSVERFKWLEQNEAQILQQAATEGIRAVADRFAVAVEFGKEMREAQEGAISIGFRFPNPIPGLSSDMKALSKMVEKAAKLPLTADMATIPAADRTFAILAPDSMSLLLVQVTDLAPCTAEKYRKLATTSQNLAGVVRDESTVIDDSKVFSYDALAERNKFKPSRAEEDAEGATADASSAG
ncbi:MAG: hypothetical protein ACKOYN_01595 [Planctomycetota bacterium]